MKSDLNSANRVLVLPLDELRSKCQEYAQIEPREVLHEVAARLLEQHWGDAEEMAKGLAVLLFSWHQAFYRYDYQSFSVRDLVAALRSGSNALDGFGRRCIESLTDQDEEAVASLFTAVMEGLKISAKRPGTFRRSPVGAAKALHLLEKRHHGSTSHL